MIKEDLANILDNIIEQKKFSNIEMNYLFTLRNYSLKERAFIKNILNLTIKNLIYIDYIIDSITKKISKRKTRQILRMSICQMYFTEADIKGVIYEANEVAKKINVEQGKFVNAVLRKVVSKKELIDKKIEEDNLEYIKLSYPKWIYEKFLIDFENGYDMLKSLKDRSYLSIRVNKKSISIENFLKKVEKLDTNILFRVDDVFYFDNYNVLESNEFNENDLIIQDASSYLVAKNMKLKNTDVVLDACSAPGGKSLAILNMYDIEKLIACDIYEHKIDKLNELKEKYKLDNMLVLNKDATNPNNFMKEYFDSILLDVPCSGFGVLKRKPEKIYNITNNNIKTLKKLQKNIFDANILFLKKGGSLIYSTCTLTKNENTNNAKYFLEKYKDLKVEKLDIPENVKCVFDEFGGVYIDPSNGFLDGFYMIKFKKE
ncbi:16S rRNA (cytosine(967)-C(5))-methyltransferase RsmB [Oceanivirga miroungae]|uniref:Fmu (Sun) domain-containing protein n=1 Tax=Oceanivirga miroungae TaxID=1130046 RepID=A0A6I8M6I3_9FUSO|nr:16S rRNA (cytosine(967)-C(5))-methyltransferase RsmB [Oceanivirga miroungae]VWL85056.1 Fmu (Sun) domain-containing protein [Oceanivirga miroungae]